MFLLLTEEKLLTLEKILKNYLPAAIKTYGTILSINRGKIPDLEVIVDSWPDFNAVICRPCKKEETSKETEFTLTVFSRDQSSLHKLLMDDNIVNWKTRFMFGGIDRNFLELMKAVAACKKSTISFTSSSYTMVLQDPKDLLDITSEHYCILDETDNPVSWLLTYPYGAMGLLYTLPEHRRKGYAKLLVTKMVKVLQNLGYPIYCFIEDENSRSYQLFQKLGFKEAPEIHAIWTWCQPS
ncbi:glycine N-acyltransferase-like protein 3 isoform X3 [Rhincodon typus]|uniref:glycine N-acyltransferase-like protein 3 isoform X3 n=1 Tax=Rhincodon typus TaxID=259920 RepID=UPI0009A359F1|nr:glycine N-acyltransferase-like protein 3 isoform X3 [Rhincodon typus]